MGAASAGDQRVNAVGFGAVRIQPTTAVNFIDRRANAVIQLVKFDLFRTKMAFFRTKISDHSDRATKTNFRYKCKYLRGRSTLSNRSYRGPTGYRLH